MHEKEDVKQLDSEKQKVLESYGLKVLRFINEEVLQKIEYVIDRIKNEVGGSQKFLNE